jgi:hypothetical protein
MDQTTILKAFNDHFNDFLNDIQMVFPENTDIMATKSALGAIRKANPKLLIKIWKEYIVDKYKPAIELGNLSFFIDKDYVDDLTYMSSSSNIMDKINTLRDPIRNMGTENQEKSMKYIQNLTKLSDLYYN